MFSRLVRFLPVLFIPSEYYRVLEYRYGFWTCSVRCSPACVSTFRRVVARHLFQNHTYKQFLIVIIMVVIGTYIRPFLLSGSNKESLYQILLSDALLCILMWCSYWYIYGQFCTVGVVASLVARSLTFIFAWVLFVVRTHHPSPG